MDEYEFRAATTKNALGGKWSHIASEIGLLVALPQSGLYSNYFFKCIDSGY